MRRFIERWFLSEKRKTYKERIQRLQGTIQTLENTNKRLERIIFSLTEPPSPEECSKVRHQTIQSAEQHAVTMEKRFKEPFTYYACDKCPIHPTTGQHYYHVAHCIPEAVRLDVSIKDLKEKFNGSA